MGTSAAAFRCVGDGPHTLLQRTARVTETDRGETEAHQLAERGTNDEAQKEYRAVVPKVFILARQRETWSNGRGEHVRQARQRENSEEHRARRAAAALPECLEPQFPGGSFRAGQLCDIDHHRRLAKRMQSALRTHQPLKIRLALDKSPHIRYLIAGAIGQSSCAVLSASAVVLPRRISELPGPVDARRVEELVVAHVGVRDPVSLHRRDARSHSLPRSIT